MACMCKKPRINQCTARAGRRPPRVRVGVRSESAHSPFPCWGGPMQSCDSPPLCMERSLARSIDCCCWIDSSLLLRRACALFPLSSCLSDSGRCGGALPRRRVCMERMACGHACMPCLASCVHACMRACAACVHARRACIHSVRACLALPCVHTRVAGGHACMRACMYARAWRVRAASWTAAACIPPRGVLSQLVANRMRVWWRYLALHGDCCRSADPPRWAECPSLPGFVCFSGTCACDSGRGECIRCVGRRR